MYLIMTSFLILGLASRGQIWGFGLRSPHPDCGSLAGAIFRPQAGDHIKWGAQKLAAPPTAAAPTDLLLADTHSFATPPRPTSLQHFIQHLADSLHAEIGVAFRDLETGKEFFFNERKMLHAASTMKVPVMSEVFRQAEQGKFHLDDSLIVKNQFNSIVDGSSYRLDIGDDSDEAIYGAIGKKMTIRRLVEQMITVSSNLATNILSAKKIRQSPQAVSSGGINKWNSGGKNSPARYRGNFARNLSRPSYVAVSSGSGLNYAVIIQP